MLRFLGLFLAFFSSRTERTWPFLVGEYAPFYLLQNKDGLLQWAIYDNSLLDDVQKERETMDAIYTKLRAETITLTHWYYGHFHQSWHSSIDGVLFKMLDIMELAEITPWLNQVL